MPGPSLRIFIAPLLAIAIVQQTLPLLGEKILFDALRATSVDGAGDGGGGGGDGDWVSGGAGGGDTGVMPGDTAAGDWAATGGGGGGGGVKNGQAEVMTSGQMGVGGGEGVDVEESPRMARVRALEASNGLGLRGIGVAASRAQSLSTVGAFLILPGIALGFVPVVGAIAATAMATTFAAYSLSW